MDMIEGEVIEQMLGKLTSFQFATLLLRKYFEIIELDDLIEKNPNDKTLKKKCSDLYRIRKSCVQRANADCLVDPKNGIVKDGRKMMKVVIDLIKKDPSFKEEYEVELNDYDLVQKNPKDSNTERDRVFVVFDRDFDGDTYNRSDDEYKKVFEKCDKKGYEILLSTPEFEIWLLMHHAGEDYSEIDFWNRDIINNRLCELENINRYKIKKINSARYDQYYKGHFEDALAESKKLATKLNDLLTGIGTNVGIKLKSLID